MVVDSKHMATSALAATDGKDHSRSQLWEEQSNQRTNSDKHDVLRLAIRTSIGKIHDWSLNSVDQPF